MLRLIYKGERSTSNCFIKNKANIHALPQNIVTRVVIKHGVAEGVVVHKDLTGK